LYAEGTGEAMINLRIGATVMDVEDSVVVVHDYGHKRTKVWAEGGSLTQYGRTWIFTGSGRLHTRGVGYFIAASGNVEKSLALGVGWAYLDTGFETLTVGWKEKPVDELAESTQVEEITSLVSQVKADQLEGDEVDAAISEITPQNAGEYREPGRLGLRKQKERGLGNLI